MYARKAALSEQALSPKMAVEILTYPKPELLGRGRYPAVQTAKDVDVAAIVHAAVYCHRMLAIKRACLLQPRTGFIWSVLMTVIGCKLPDELNALALSSPYKAVMAAGDVLPACCAFS